MNFNFADELGHVFQKIGSFFSNRFSSDNQEKAKAVVDQIATGYHKVMAVSKAAAPFVEMIAAAAGGPPATAIVQAAESAGLVLDDVLTNTNSLIKDAGRQTIAMEATKQHFLAAIAQGGQIQYGDTVLKTAADVLAIPDEELRTGVQNAVFVWKTTQAVLSGEHTQTDKGGASPI